MFIKGNDLFTNLKDIYKQGDTVDIATYSMYVDITKGKDWSIIHGQNPARAFLSTIPSDKLRIIVGLPYFQECKPGCLHCRAKYRQSLERLQDTKALLHLNMRVNPESHLKYYRLGDRIFVGGINLTPSDWMDVSMEVTDPEEKMVLGRLFEQHWKDSSETIPYQIGQGGKNYEF